MCNTHDLSSVACSRWGQICWYVQLPWAPKVAAHSAVVNGVTRHSGPGGIFHIPGTQASKTMRKDTPPPKKIGTQSRWA